VDGTVNPGVEETCGDGVDQDCDGEVDEDEDLDGDGYGDASGSPVSSCEAPAGFADNGGDCDDGDPAVNPDAIEVNGDGIDQDCDGHDPLGWAGFDGGGRHSCGLTTLGEITCWGLDQEGETQVVPGVYQQVTAGIYVSCGPRTDGSAVCWGYNSHG
jgi:hypothetical protein